MSTMRIQIKQCEKGHFYESIFSSCPFCSENNKQEKEIKQEQFQENFNDKKKERTNMATIKCSKGHLYDSKQGTCPICAQGTVNWSFGDGVPNTEPGWGDSEIDDIGATMPSDEFIQKDVGATKGVTDLGFTDGDFNPGSSGGYSFDNSRAYGRGDRVDDFSPTEHNYVNDFYGFDPVVGWLVCIKGPNRGKDYRLHSGTNFIGRSKEMDICIENDQTISKCNAASISYDDRTKTFFIEKGEVRNLLYLNGKPVRSDADIEIYDRIEIGSTELVFVPLCCEKFNWQGM